MEPMSQALSNFNYDLIAELFPTRRDVQMLPAIARRGGGRPTGYGRFARAAYAVRFAIEELPADLLFETCLRVDEQIFDSDGIRKLYESESYPFIRRTPTWNPRGSNILPWKRKSR
jgi:hypothetical protein